MTLESLLYKAKGIHQLYAEMSSQARAHLRWSRRQWKGVLWSDATMFQLVLGKNRHRVVSPKEERDQPDFHQRQVQEQTSVLRGASVQVILVTCIRVKVSLTGIYLD